MWPEGNPLVTACPTLSKHLGTAMGIVNRLAKKPAVTIIKTIVIIEEFKHPEPN